MKDLTVTAPSAGEANTLIDKLRHAAASGYGDMELMEIADKLATFLKPPKLWQARWFGSDPKGAHIWDGGGIVAFIGETKAHLETAREIVEAHNAQFAPMGDEARLREALKEVRAKLVDLRDGKTLEAIFLMQTGYIVDTALSTPPKGGR